MPPRAVEHGEDLLASPCADRLGKFGEGDRSGGYPQGQQPDYLPGVVGHDIIGRP
jgi:hypothetical protein